MPPPLLFLTRKFPPSVGGMETLASAVWRSLVIEVPDAVLVAHGGTNRALPRWLPGALMSVVRAVRSGRVACVLTGDALMYVVAAPLLRLLGVPRATMAMGLDLTFDNRWYQVAVRRALSRAPKVLAISRATAAEARIRGVPDDRVEVVPLGVSIPEVSRDQRAAARRALGERLGIETGEVLLLTLGRVVRRKGAAWFVREVMPKLPAHTHYVVAGDGANMDDLRAAVAASPLRERLHVLGAVGDRDRELMLRGADLFVQPNVRVPGDMEGYGLVTIEAPARGTPVVASALEGILDAVIPDVTGILAPPEDAPGWVACITELIADPRELVELGQRHRLGVIATRSEAAMGRAVLAALAPLCRPGGQNPPTRGRSLGSP